MPRATLSFVPVFLLVVAPACRDHQAREAPPAPKLTDAQRTEAHALIAAIRKQADNDDSARRRAVLRDRTLSGTGACAVTGRDLFGDIDLMTRAQSELTVNVLGRSELFLDGTPPTEAGLARTRVDNTLDALERHLDGELDRAPGELLAAIRAVRVPAYEVSVVVDELVEPRAIDSKSFASGLVAGTIFAWGSADQRNLCAARLAGANDDHATVMVKRGKQATKSQIETAAIGNLLVPAIARAALQLQALSTVKAATGAFTSSVR
jgi:hypothetical protein